LLRSELENLAKPIDKHIQVGFKIPSADLKVLHRVNKRIGHKLIRCLDLLKPSDAISPLDFKFLDPGELIRAGVDNELPVSFVLRVELEFSVALHLLAAFGLVPKCLDVRVNLHGVRLVHFQMLRDVHQGARDEHTGLRFSRSRGFVLPYGLGFQNGLEFAIGLTGWATGGYTGPSLWRPLFQGFLGIRGFVCRGVEWMILAGIGVKRR